MADWNVIRMYIKEEYNTEEESPGVFKLVYKKSNGRTQDLLLRYVKDDTGREWVVITSFIGPVYKNLDILEVLSYASQFVCGGVVSLASKEHIYYKHSALLEDLSAVELDIPLRIVAEAADTLEEEFYGTDYE